LFEHGLPNFRYYENLPLAATAQPNVRGVRSILQILHEVSRRRDRRMEAEAAVEEAAAAAAAGGDSTATFDERLREVVQKHALADRKNQLQAAQVSHSISTTNLNRMVSDSSDDIGIERLRYKSGSMDVNNADVESRPPLYHAATMPTLTVNHHANSHKILWINLREESVLFINSEPYLIRDYHHPFRVLTEFNTGMTQERTEQVEEAFKADVLHELQDSTSTPTLAGTPDLLPHEKRLVVHEETMNGQIRPRFEIVREPIHANVQTTQEVYQSLARFGFNIEFHRVPLHVEEGKLKIQLQH